MIQEVLPIVGLLGIASLFGATIYESVVMAPNYERDIPSSIELARQFLRRRTPANYFRIISPLTQLLLFGSVIACWGFWDVRWYLIAALGALVLSDVITFTFHYPRLTIMFKGPMPEDHQHLRKAARQWATGNWVRAVLLLVALLVVVRALMILGRGRVGI
jgi:hypothetical protein